MIDFSLYETLIAGILSAESLKWIWVTYWENHKKAERSDGGYVTYRPQVTYNLSLSPEEAKNLGKLVDINIERLIENRLNTFKS